MFIRHIPVSNPAGSIRLSCRFVDARYNLNSTTALLTRFYFYPKNPFKSLRPGHRLVFLCPCFSCPFGNACLVLFRKDGVIVTRCRLFGGGHPTEGRPTEGRPTEGRPAQTHHDKFIGNEFIHYIHVIHPTGQQSCCCLFQINRLDNQRLPVGW
jgi:hypothetical protein